MPSSSESQNESNDGDSSSGQEKEDGRNLNHMARSFMQPLTSSDDADLEAGLEMSAIEHQDNKVFYGIL